MKSTTVEKALYAIELECKAQHDAAEAVYTLSECEADLELVKALSETKAIAAAGGIKAVGSNEDSQRRALTVALACNEVYNDAVVDVRNATEDLAKLRADAAAWGKRAAVMLAALNAGIIEIHYEDKAEPVEAPEAPPVCTCRAEVMDDLDHANNCPLYEAPEAPPACTCGVPGEYDDCPMYQEVK